jgi:two-component system OmpR family sensor kinase
MPEPQIAALRLAELADDLRALYPVEVAAGRLRVAVADGDARLAADRAQLRQALINLVKNGLEATAGGGSVSVELGEREAVATLIVADDGPGLDPARRERPFAPGVTTKREGSGLGLTIVERIVNAHGGTVAVASEPGSGTRFEIRLPRSGMEG